MCAQRNYSNRSRRDPGSSNQREGNCGVLSKRPAAGVDFFLAVYAERQKWPQDTRGLGSSQAGRAASVIFKSLVVALKNAGAPRVAPPTAQCEVGAVLASEDNEERAR